VVAGQLKFGFVPAAAVHNPLTYLFHSLADTYAIQHHNDHPFNKLQDDHGELHSSTRFMDLVKRGGGARLVYYYYYYLITCSDVMEMSPSLLRYPFPCLRVRLM